MTFLGEAFILAGPLAALMSLAAYTGGSVIEFVVKNEPREWYVLLAENFGVWLILYGTAHLVLYVVSPTRRRFHPSKFNPEYPPGTLVWTEFLLSAFDVVVICTGYDLLMNELARAAQMPLASTGAVSGLFSQQVSAVTPLEASLLVMFLYFYGDAHFYWTHRLLHTRWLYQNVHKIHHQSYNPDPFSGLSMHPIESAIYFSAAPLLGLCTPLWVFRAMKLGLIIFPLAGHMGFGDWDSPASRHHYIHHAKFNWNYGSSTIWDTLCQTNYAEGKVAGARAKMQASVADEQAALVGIKLTAGRMTTPVAPQKAA